MEIHDSAIDTSDISMLLAQRWLNAKRGKFYRRIKTSVQFRIEADVPE
jgi:hypothetical protein